MKLTCLTAKGAQNRDISLNALVIAGWTGRDVQALEAHIQELEALGVPRPKTTPVFYRAAVDLLTVAPSIQTPGKHATGEVEAVLVSLEDGLWVGVGSDHTDRQLETHSVTLSKQVCAKPMARELWRFDDIKSHWDDLLLTSYATIGGKRRLYQQGPVAAMRTPEELISLYCGSGKNLPAGTAMFCGTHAVNGEIAFATRFEIELADPVLNRTISHAYEIEALPMDGE